MRTNKQLNYISLFFAIISANSTFPYVSQVDLWSKGNQYLYCLSDYHTNSPYSITQRNNLIDLAKESKSLIIVEDIASYEGNHQGIKEHFPPYTPARLSTQFLVHIATQAKLAHVPVRNVEFRQATVGGIDYTSITAKEALDLVEEVEQEVRSYRDGKPFDTYYRTMINNWDQTVGKPLKQWFAPIRNSDQFLWQAVQTLPYHSILKAVLTPYQEEELPENVQKQLVFKLYNSMFLDLRILHELSKAQNYKAIYLCAGSGHIKRIAPFLDTMGFTYKGSVSHDDVSTKQFDLKEAHKALSSYVNHQEADKGPDKTYSKILKPKNMNLTIIAILLLVALLLSYIITIAKKYLLHYW